MSLRSTTNNNMAARTHTADLGACTPVTPTPSITSQQLDICRASTTARAIKCYAACKVSAIAPSALEAALKLPAFSGEAES